MRKNTFTTLSLAILLAIVLSLSALPQSISAQGPEETVTLRVGGKCAVNPHMMPFWVLMEQTGGEFDNVQIEYVPVTGPPQLVALAINNQVDVSFAFIIGGVRFFDVGEAENLRLHTVSLWRAVTVIAGPDVENWEDLVGERILFPQQGCVGDTLPRYSMERAGYDPDEDFEIEYMPAPQMTQLLIAGEAAAAVVAEPQATTLLGRARQNDVELRRAPIDLNEGVYESELWEEGLLPLGVVLVQQPILDDPATNDAFESFVELYYEAAVFAEENPEEAAAMIVNQASEHCDSNMQPTPIQQALATGFLVYDPILAGDLMPDLAEFVTELYGEEIDETFYVQAADES